MIWLRGLIGARWFLPALILIPSAVAAVFGYGYMKGSASATEAALIDKNQALAEQRDRLLAQAEKHRIAALEGQRKRYETASRIRDVRRPADVCALSAECLRYHDDIIRAATGGAGVDAAVHGPGAGGGGGLD